MEREEDYQKVVSYLAQLEALHARIDECELVKACSEAKKNIVLEFDKCLIALATRKEQLLCKVDAKLQRQKNLLQLQQQELKTGIEGCRRILEGGSLLYDANKDIAVAIWKNVSTLKHPKLELGLPSVEFSSSIVDSVKVHGTASIKNKHIDCCVPGYVSTLSNQDCEESKLNNPSAIHFNPQDDTLFVCDASSNTIKKIALKAGTVITCKDAGQFRSLGGIAFYHQDNVGYVIDKYSHSIKRITTNWLGVRAGLLSTNLPITVVIYKIRFVRR